MRRTLDEILARAREELRVNPTITVYKILDDGHVLRRPAYPFAGLRAGMARITDAIAEMTVNFKDFSKAVDAAVAPLRNMRLPGVKEK